MTAAATLITITVGLPWLFLVVAGSPIPDHIPRWSQALAALSRRDDGTLLLATVKYLAWLVWVIWTGTVLLEAGAHVTGRPAPHIPGLGGPQRLAALLITSLGAAVIGTMASISRGTALPTTTPPSLAAAAPPPHTSPVLRNVAATEPAPAPQTPRGAPAAPPAGRRPLAVPADLRTSARPEHRQTVVRFAFGSAGLAPDAHQTIAAVARDIAAHADPTRPIVLVGHTDSLGSAPYNQHLSLRRAQTIRETLAQALPPGFRFQVSGQGENAPLGPEHHPDGTDDQAARARDRRVEISYTLTPPDTPHATPSQTNPRQGDSPAATATPPTPEPTSPRPPGAPSPPQTTAPTHAPTTIDLPSGAMVGLSFAAGIGTALAASRLHRRRRHRTPSTGPDLSVSEPQPKPAVRALRRADLTARQAGHHDPSQAPPHTDAERLHMFPVASSGQVALGVHGEQETTVPISGLALGLTGPGADAAARALVLGLLTHAGDHDIELVIPRSDATRLLALSRQELQETARHIRALRITADIEAAIRILESERIHRARLLDTAGDGHDLATLRTGDPTEPLPYLTLFTTTSREHQRRLEALSNASSEYDIAVVTLGIHPSGLDLNVDEHGNVTPADTLDARWQGLRLFHLTTADARQTLDVIRSAHGAPESAPSPTGPDLPAPAPPTPLQEANTSQHHPAHLRVLGPPTLSAAGGELSTGIRGKARELLTFLAVHSDGTSRDAILEALWPDIDQRRAVMRFHAAVNDVRRELRRASGLTDESFITVVADRYRIDAELVGVDLWHFRTALHKASGADDDRMRVGLLQDALDSYAGELAAQQPYEWIEPEREALRRLAVEAFTQLAALHERDKPDRALAALERARNLDQYGEEIYQRIMSLQARLGRTDAVRRTFHLLETALEELGADPNEETQQLLWRLLHRRAKPGDV